MSDKIRHQCPETDKMWTGSAYLDSPWESNMTQYKWICGYMGASWVIGVPPNHSSILVFFFGKWTIQRFFGVPLFLGDSKMYNGSWTGSHCHWYHPVINYMAILKIASMELSWGHGGTPKSFIRIFHEINHQPMGVPPWLWRPPFMEVLIGK